MAGLDINPNWPIVIIVTPYILNVQNAMASPRSSLFMHRYRQGEFLKSTKDPVEEYFREKFRELGISVVPPKKNRRKQD